MKEHKEYKEYKEYKCNEIKKLMINYLSGEPMGTDQQSGEIANHLHACSRCSREYDVLKEIYSKTRHVNGDAEAVMQTIDWQENARDISLAVHINQSRCRSQLRSRLWGFPLQPLNWKLAVPALAGVFILGIWLGYLLFYRTPQRPLPVELIHQGDNALIQRLETTLTRREMQEYFLQTQLLLTDLMRQCDENGAATWSNGASRQRVQTLLNKNHYFNEDLTNPELLSSRRLLKKIEWLLYEIIELDDKASCRQLQRIQDYIQKEKLLLKLRLVGKDISFNEV